MPRISQRTIVQVKRTLEQITERYAIGEELYERDLPDWFIQQAQNEYQWRWLEILIALRNEKFFRPPSYYLNDETDTIIPDELSGLTPTELGEILIQKLAAVAVVLLPNLRFSELARSLPRSLELDGFDVDESNIKLVPLDGPVSAQEEGDYLTRFIKASGLPNRHIVLKHVEDASSLFADGKDHPSLNESRNIIQSMIDGISTETATYGKHAAKIPGGTSNRIDYLNQVGFLTNDEKTAFNSAWGTLSAGSHPGVPEREQSRIGLILALEFGQLLMLKFADWKKNAYQGFS